MIRSNVWRADSVPVYRVRGVATGECIVGQCEGWTLVRRKRSTTNDWWPLKLYRTVPARKVTYWLAYNSVERRMARSKDQAVLETHDPMIADWVWLVARKHAVLA